MTHLFTTLNFAKFRFDVNSSTKLLFIYCLCFMGLTGCNTTANKAPITTPIKIERLDYTCLSQVENLKNIKHSTPSQHIMLADLSLSCLKTTDFPPRHEDTEKAMQLLALSFVNYIKAGDVQTAQTTFLTFKQTFPQQDLLFADYTSFIDTATALLSHQGMSDSTLALLNINANLRDELKRKRIWSLN